MRGNLFRGAAVIAALSLAAPPLASAQTTEPTEQTEATTFNAEHLDALLAPVALYPDALLVQVLMASTFPLQVVEASRWLEQPDQQGSAGRRAWRRRWRPQLGSEREIAGAVPTGAGDAEQPARMDAAAGLRVRDPAGRRDGVACNGCGIRRRRAAVWRRPGSSASPRRTAPSPSSLPARKPSTCRSTIRPRSMAPGQIRRISRCIFLRRPTIRWTARSLVDWPLRAVR